MSNNDLISTRNITRKLNKLGSSIIGILILNIHQQKLLIMTLT